MLQSLPSGILTAGPHPNEIQLDHFGLLAGSEVGAYEVVLSSWVLLGGRGGARAPLFFLALAV